MEECVMLYCQEWSNEELDRLNQLKAMHQLMLMAKNSNIYNQWVEVFADIPSQFDFESIAKSEPRFMECYNAFCKLIASKDYLTLENK